MSLIESVNNLNSQVNALRTYLDTNISSIRNGSIFAGRNFSSTGINFFETCNTVIEGNCTIQPSSTSPLPCDTPEVPLNIVSGINVL
jgi:hypothetical protein